MEDSKFLENLLQSKKIEITDMICDISTIFEDIKILKRSSSSASVQALARIRGNTRYEILKEYLKRTPDIFLKIVLLQKNDNTHLVEKTIYKYLTRLISENRTPNFMRFVAAFECKNIFEMADSLDTDNRYEMQYTVDDIFDNKSGVTRKNMVLVLERGNGDSLIKLMPSLTDKKEFISIMFQVFYTLREMFMSKVKHNDLHTGNIWIDVLPDYKDMIYFINDNEYAQLRTKYIVKIYDFDLSSFTKGDLQNDAVKQMCVPYGICSNENPYFDIHTVCYYLIKYSWKPFVEDFVNEVIRNKQYLEDGCCAFPGRMCGKNGYINTPIARKKKVKSIISPTSSSPSPPPGFSDLSSVKSQPNKGCDKNFVPAAGDIYDLVDLWSLTNVFDSLKYNLSTNKFEKRNLPSFKILDEKEIPEMAFDNNKNVYFSQSCTQSPVMMANRLLALFG